MQWGIIPYSCYPYDILIYLLTAIGLTPNGSSTVHIYTQTVHIMTQQQEQHNNRATQLTTRTTQLTT